MTLPVVVLYAFAVMVVVDAVCIFGYCMMRLSQIRARQRQRRRERLSRERFFRDFGIEFRRYGP